MDRHSNAALSAHEMSSLRALSHDPGHPISAPHRTLLLAMKLVEPNAGNLIVTGAGRRRLEEIEARFDRAEKRSLHA